MNKCVSEMQHEEVKVSRRYRRVVRNVQVRLAKGKGIFQYQKKMIMQRAIKMIKDPHLSLCKNPVIDS